MHGGQPEAARPLATITPSGTVINPQKPSLVGASYPSWSGLPAILSPSWN